MKKELLLFIALMVLCIIGNAQEATPLYTIDFDEDEPEVKHISPQVAEITGDILYYATKESAGFGYKITMTVSGGPSGSTPINFAHVNTNPELDPYLVKTAASMFQSSSPKVGKESKGYFQTLLVYSLQGWISDDDKEEITYYRDPSTKMRFELELTNGADLENITYQLGDMDYNFISTKTGVDACPVGSASDEENYACRISYIDQITIISGAGGNEYSFDDSKIVQTDDVFYAKFPDANNNQLMDVQSDGRVNYDETYGNITIHNEGNIGKKIIFEYDDPGFPTEAEANGLRGEGAGSSSRSSQNTNYHDFDSQNQLMYFLSGLTFGSCPSSNDALAVDIYPGDTHCYTINTANYSVSPLTNVSITGNTVCFSPTVTTTYTLSSTVPGCNHQIQLEVRVWNELNQANVPTMSEWGLMIFGLLILNVSVICLFRQEELFEIN